MDLYTKDSQVILDDRFEMAVEGVYYAHQPIYGYRSPYSPTSCIAKYMVNKSVLNALKKYRFSNFIDIGGAEGYAANLVKQLFDVPVKSTDLSKNACEKAKAIFNIDAVAADIHNLPFSDNEFDAVLCSETLEHVTDFKKAITELLRITKKILIITVPHETPEIVAKNIKDKVPHGHIHYFDTSTLDYLRDHGHRIQYEKTLSPLLIVPRVIAEAFKKPADKLHFKFYNLFTPVFEKLFALKTANKLINLDVRFTKAFGAYGGITFIIEKKWQPKKRHFQGIKAEAFTGIKVKEFKINEPVFRQAG